MKDKPVAPDGAAKPGEPADDPRITVAREESIKERKARQAAEEKFKKLEADQKAFQDGLLKLLGKGPEDDPKTAAENAVRERDSYKVAAERALVRSALINEAVKAGSHDPEAAASLADVSAVKVDLATGKVEGAAEAMGALIKAKSYLVKGSAPPPAGGTPPASDASPKALSQEEYDKLKDEARRGDHRAMAEFEKRLPEFRKMGLKL